ncbi:hypothetical protein [Victivallis sp. Marseille-Q1083]|uniref:hypothetical protein n=1 Tax=Victivallis sp. Marseille-Q1083 TaxID=2717288 RepID=UPI00158DAAE8|nr:hypothetical protein [Victivallis sp. Marseille-Q1083]
MFKKFVCQNPQKIFNEIILIQNYNDIEINKNKIFMPFACIYDQCDLNTDETSFLKRLLLAGMYYFDAIGPDSSKKHDSVDWLQVMITDIDGEMNIEDIETFWEKGDKYDSINDTIDRICQIMTDSDFTHCNQLIVVTLDLRYYEQLTQKLEYIMDE